MLARPELSAFAYAGGSLRKALPTVLVSLLMGCAQLPPTPQDIQAKRFEPVPDKAVIYVVRQPMDSREPGGLLMDNGEQVTTLGGTYYRWEVTPGVHRILGLNPANVSLTLSTEPGRIYFLRHTVLGTLRSGPQLAALTPIDEALGRSLVLDSQLVR
jgi:hypothetical protein